MYDQGRVPLYHFDWYRLSGADELYDMGLDEYLGGDGIAVVEWPSRCAEAVPADHLRVRIDPLDEETRSITWTAQGGFRPVESPDETA